MTLPQACFTGGKVFLGAKASLLLLQTRVLSLWPNNSKFVSLNVSPEGIWLVCVCSCKFQSSFEAQILGHGLLSWSTPSQSMIRSSCPLAVDSNVVVRQFIVGLGLGGSWVVPEHPNQFPLI